LDDAFHINSIQPLAHGRVLAVRALDGRGHVLATSPVATAS